MSIFFNSQDHNQTSQNANVNLNLSSLRLTGEMNSVGINNQILPIVSTTNLNLTGSAQFSMELNALEGRVLTCNSAGLGSWVSPLNGYDSLTDTTTLIGTTLTTGITNELKPISTNININLTGTARLKYPTGSINHVLTSDETGLLSLQSQGTGTSYLTGDFINSNTLSGNPGANRKYNIGTITIEPGKWLINYKFGFSNNSVNSFIMTGAISSIDIVSSGVALSDSTSYDNFTSYTLPTARIYHFNHHMFIYENTSSNDITFNLAISFRTTATSITGNPFSGSYCFATRLN